MTVSFHARWQRVEVSHNPELVMNVPEVEKGAIVFLRHDQSRDSFGCLFSWSEGPPRQLKAFIFQFTATDRFLWPRCSAKTNLVPKASSLETVGQHTHQLQGSQCGHLKSDAGKRMSSCLCTSQLADRGPLWLFLFFWLLLFHFVWH